MVVVTADAVLFAAGEAADMAVSGIWVISNDLMITAFQNTLP